MAEHNVLLQQNICLVQIRGGRSQLDALFLFRLSYQLDTK